MINPDITNAVQQYVFTQSNGNVTEPVNGSWLQAYCEYLGITEPVNASWLQPLCNYFGITQPLYGSWVIALAYHHGITAPLNGTWWWALAYAQPLGAAEWQDINTVWEMENRNWEAIA